MKLKMLSLLAFTALGTSMLTACNETTEKDTTTNTTAGDQAAITITPVGNSPEFNGATLTVEEIKSELKGSDSVTITLNYGVQNYELKSQTADAAGKGCNNSKDGQHIHFILDNQPYTALYEPTHTFTIPVNSTHYVMSFLSRSYHESLKNKEAGVLLHFSVDEKGKLTKLANPSGPMIFYSRPKGDYLGEDTRKVLLDFYVYGTQLAPDGHKVKAVINGTDFVIDQWQPYFIEQAPMGEMSVELVLQDSNGNVVQGDHTQVSRKVQLAESEPMK